MEDGNDFCEAQWSRRLISKLWPRKPWVTCRILHFRGLPWTPRLPYLLKDTNSHFYHKWRIETFSVKPHAKCWSISEAKYISDHFYFMWIKGLVGKSRLKVISFVQLFTCFSLQLHLQRMWCLKVVVFVNIIGKYRFQQTARTAISLATSGWCGVRNNSGQALLFLGIADNKSLTNYRRDWPVIWAVCYLSNVAARIPERRLISDFLQSSLP